MRILMLSDFYPPDVRGGLEHHVDALAGELAERDHEIHVATLSPSGYSAHTAVHVHPVRTAAAKVIKHADASRPFHPPLPDPLARRQLAALLSQISPDVIHGHSWLAVSLPRSNRIPLVFTAHDYSLVCQLRTLFTPSGDICGGPGRACFSCGARRHGAGTSALMTVGTAAGRSRLRPKAFIALSNAVARVLAGHVKDPVLTIPGFLPAASCTRASGRNPSLPPEPYVMYAGDPGEHKGLGELIALWESAEPPAANLLIASTKPVHRSLPVGCTVQHLSADEMALAFRRACLAVVPSRWPEPFGMVALEALSAGTPVIASSVGGLREIIRDGVDGYLVPPGDAKALREHVALVLADPQLCSSMSRSASERALDFRADRIIPQIEQVYRSVTKPAGPEPVAALSVSEYGEPR
jgi:glycosyltransferase involved in cell wall biosynthesis